MCPATLPESPISSPRRLKIYAPHLELTWHQPCLAPPWTNVRVQRANGTLLGRGKMNTKMNSIDFGKIARIGMVAFALVLASCAQAPAPDPTPAQPAAPTAAGWSAEELAALSRTAEYCASVNFSSDFLSGEYSNPWSEWHAACKCIYDAVSAKYPYATVTYQNNLRTIFSNFSQDGTTSTCLTSGGISSGESSSVTSKISDVEIH